MSGDSRLDACQAALDELSARVDAYDKLDRLDAVWSAEQHAREAARFRIWEKNVDKDKPPDPGNPFARSVVEGHHAAILSAYKNAAKAHEYAAQAINSGSRYAEAASKHARKFTRQFPGVGGG